MRNTASRWLIAAAAVLLVAVMALGIGVWLESRRSSLLEQNMRAIGQAMREYARSAEGEFYPPVSSTPGVLFMDAASLSPAYLDDPGAVVSPRHPKARALRRHLGRVAMNPAALERIGAESYHYLGYVTQFEIVGMAYIEAYRAAAAVSGWQRPFLTEAALEVSFPEGYTGPREPAERSEHQAWAGRGPGSAGGHVIHRLREGIERFLIPDAMVSGPSASAQFPSNIPLLIERPARMGRPIRVLYMDLRVATVPFGHFPNTHGFLEGLEALRQLSP